MFDLDSPINRFPNACPCCGYATLNERGGWNICLICWWEDDGQDNHNANVVCGGPNGKLSLTRARINFLTDGIFCPSRTDLRDKQSTVESHEHQRLFRYDSSTQTICEPALNWTASILDLDDNPTHSRFKTGDSVTYRRRDLDATNRTGTIETVQWKSNTEVWHYRLLDDSGRSIKEWFDGSRLRPNIE